MNHESIAKGILGGIIDRYIADIAVDPNRSIRKLVDMAERTSDGPTQKICYQMMQQMAADESSPYYEMIHHLVTGVSPETIRCFGINLGHNAWTFGSGHVRKISEDRNVSIPWAVLVDRRIDPKRIPFSEISDLAARGRAMDIYGWLILCGDALDEWDAYAELFRAHDDCVFGLCVSPQALRDEIIEEAVEIRNLMILVETDGENWQEAAEKLARSQCLFSVYRTVRDESSAAEVTGGDWFEEIVPFYPLMAFTLTADDCPEAVAAEIQRYMWQSRLGQVCPVLPGDLISDFLLISRLVSHREVFYRVETDGSVSEGKGLHFVPGKLRCRDLFCAEVPAE